MTGLCREDMEYENQQFTHFMLMTKFYRVEDEVFPVEEYYETFQAVSNFLSYLEAVSCSDFLQFIVCGL